MTKTTKSQNGLRKPRRLKYLPCINTMQVALMRASKLTAAELAQILDPLATAINAMVTGQPVTEAAWQHCASAVSVALSIERQGVVKGLADHLARIDAMLLQIATSCRDDGGIWLESPPIDAVPESMHDDLRLLYELHQCQLSNLSSAEFYKALRHAIAEVQRVGGTVFEAAQ
jgi:hypothetical protein